MPLLSRTLRLRHTPVSGEENQAQHEARQSGTSMTSAHLLVVLLVGAVIGALAGLGLGSLFANPWYLAIVAGFFGTIISCIARDFIASLREGPGAERSRTPTLVLAYAAVASLAGSSAATEVAQQSGVSSSVWIGTLAGLFSAILMAMLMITYYTQPGQAPKLRS